MRYGNREEHCRHRQRHEHYLHGDVQAHHRGELSRRPGPDARRHVPGSLPRHARFAARRKRAGEMRGLLPVRRGLPFELHLHRGCREHRNHRVSGAERYAKVYNIDYNRCIFCGYCVEACPTDAITHGHGFELATYNASNLVYRKEQLLAGTPAHEGANAIFSQYEKAPPDPQEIGQSRGSASLRHSVAPGCRAPECASTAGRCSSSYSISASARSVM